MLLVLQIAAGVVLGGVILAFMKAWAEELVTVFNWIFAIAIAGFVLFCFGYAAVTVWQMKHHHEPSQIAKDVLGCVILAIIWFLFHELDDKFSFTRQVYRDARNKPNKP